MDDRRYHSPDGQLCLLVTTPDGDITIGFDGCPSHIHGDILAELYGCDEKTAVTRFVADIVENRQIIAIWRVSGRVRDIWVPEHNGNSLDKVVADLNHYGEANETVEFRLWNGKEVVAPSVG
jgi:hypothetical protein